MTGFCDSRYDSLAASEIPTNMLFSALKYVRFFKYVQNLSMKPTVHELGTTNSGILQYENAAHYAGNLNNSWI